MTKLSIIFPSRRPEQLARCLNQLVKTIEGFDVEIVVIADAPGIAKAAAPYTDFIISSEPTTAIDAWNLGASMANGDWFFLGADDLYFTAGWLDALWPYLTPEYGVVGVDDDARSWERIGWATHFAASRTFCIDYMGGVFLPPVYAHGFPDPEVCAVAITNRLFAYVPECLVEHRHYVWGKADNDAIYQAGDATFAADRKLHHERRALGFPVTWRPMIHAEAILV